MFTIALPYHIHNQMSSVSFLFCFDSSAGSWFRDGSNVLYTLGGGLGAAGCPHPEGTRRRPQTPTIGLTRVGKEGLRPSECLFWWSCWWQGSQARPSEKSALGAGFGRPQAPPLK